MITIRKSPTADTRTCDFANTSKETLYASSEQHIADVQAGLRFLIHQLANVAQVHDEDKLADIDGFHADFVHGFVEPHTTWWTKHRQLNRHHLNVADGVPEDVNLLDVLDYIVDCTMAGMARSGSVRPIEIAPAVLMRAFHNTCALLERNVRVEEEGGGHGGGA